MGQAARAPRPTYRTVLAVFLVGLVAGLTARDLVTTAHAQMNPGQQRIETNQGLGQLNAKADDILDILRNGTLKVRVIGTDKTGGSAQSIMFDSNRSEEPSPEPAPQASEAAGESSSN